MKNKESSISEKIIEDILASDKSIIADILNIDSVNLKLLARQKSLESGKLDLLYLYKGYLILIELKSVAYSSYVIQQIESYYQDLILLQQENKLINTEIKKIILVPKASTDDVEECLKNEINLVVYNASKGVE